MYLVDTSVWIDALRTQPRAPARRLLQLELSDAALFICGPVLQELLQGARDELTLARYLRLFATQRFAPMQDPRQTYADAGHLYARCRWRGVTPRSSNDCLIARIAIEHDLTLLHDDTDFDKIAKVQPQLKLA